MTSLRKSKFERISQAQQDKSKSPLSKTRLLLGSINNLAADRSLMLNQLFDGNGETKPFQSICNYLLSFVVSVVDSCGFVCR